MRGDSARFSPRKNSARFDLEVSGRFRGCEPFIHKSIFTRSKRHFPRIRSPYSAASAGTFLCHTPKREFDLSREKIFQTWPVIWRRGGRSSRAKRGEHLDVIAAKFVQRLACRVDLNHTGLFIHKVRAFLFDHFPRLADVSRYSVSLQGSGGFFSAS